MIHIVLGAFFGDEGKGQIVHNLSDSNSIIVRFSGGSQSGHTVISGNKNMFSVILEVELLKDVLLIGQSIVL